MRHIGIGLSGLLCALIICGRSEAQERDASDAAAMRWINEHKHALASLTSSDYGDLAFLPALIAGKRIVQLGESTHGATEFNQIKIRLVRFLHEQLGYNVLAFESDLFSCFQVNRALPAMPPDTAMWKCITGVWWTSDMLALMEYVASTRNTSRPLHLVGFDVQMQGPPAFPQRPNLLHTIITTIDRAAAQRAYELDSTFLAMRLLAGGWDKYVADISALGPRLIASYDSLADLMERHRPALDSAFRKSDPGGLWLARAIVRSVPAHVRQLLLPGNEGVAARGQGMAWNIEHIAEDLYPNEKIIIWAHNDHVRHNHAQVIPSSGLPLRVGMGTHLRERYGTSLYTIGVYMLRGASVFADDPGQIWAVAPPSAGSLEALFTSAGGGNVFVDLASPADSPGTRWISTPIITKWWGKEDETLVLRDQYDAIMIIDTVRPSQLVLPWRTKRN